MHLKKHKVIKEKEMPIIEDVGKTTNLDDTMQDALRKPWERQEEEMSKKPQIFRVLSQDIYKNNSVRFRD